MLQGGHETIIGRFETESGKANVGHEPQLLHALPSVESKCSESFELDRFHEDESR